MKTPDCGHRMYDLTCLDCAVTPEYGEDEPMVTPLGGGEYRVIWADQSVSILRRNAHTRQWDFLEPHTPDHATQTGMYDR